MTSHVADPNVKSCQSKTLLLQRSKQMGCAIYGALFIDVRETLQIGQPYNQEQGRLALQGFWPKGWLPIPGDRLCQGSADSNLSFLLTRALQLSPQRFSTGSGLSLVVTALSPKWPQTVVTVVQTVANRSIPLASGSSEIQIHSGSNPGSTVWKWTRPGSTRLGTLLEGHLLSPSVCSQDSKISPFLFLTR